MCRYPFIASEVLSCEIPGVSKIMLDDANTLLGPFWDAMLSADALFQRGPVPLHEHPLTMGAYTGEKQDDEASDKKTNEPSKQHRISARTHGPGFSVLAGYWSKVNMTLLERHPNEMLAFVKTQPNVVEGLTNHFETPAMVELLYRLIQCEDTIPDSGIVAWLAEHGLIPRVVSLLSPFVSPDSHKAASEFLKTIISLSAPSPSSLNQVTIQETFGGPGEMLIGAGGVNNLLVRELASQENVDKMVSFMLDYEVGASSRNSISQDLSRKLDMPLQTLEEDTAVEEEEEEQDVWEFHQAMKNLQNRHLSMSRNLSMSGNGIRDSTATIRPSILRRCSSIKSTLSPKALVSSFVCCAGVFIELIRKNNSDYFEQHLFHTLRNYLVIRQQEVSSQRQKDRVSDPTSPEVSGPESERKPELLLDDLPMEDDADTEGLDEAMDEVAEKMGIVHLGPLLHALADKIPDFQEKMRHPFESTDKIMTSLGEIEPLTQTRYCIAELYAELLHCSNMALLNRPPNSGPKYSSSGSLLGGLEGLHALARSLQGEDDYDQSNPNTQSSAEWSPDEASSTNEAEVSGQDRSPSFLSSENDQEDDESDAESIASALSSMSLADMIAQFARPRSSQKDSDVQIVGNFLKTQFQTFQVIPTLIDMMLSYPWNNFLHNVVYDIIQQLFNSDIDVAINRKLIISVFKDAHLVEAILEGARRNRISSEDVRHIRLGYMGHLNLIAEEIIRLLERFPMEIGNLVQDHFTEGWDQFMKEELSESRAKESMPLAGGRPSAGGMGMQNWSSLDSDNWYSNNDNHSFAQYLSSQMRTDADEEEADGNVLSFIGDSDAMVMQGDTDQDEWGPFADSRSAFEFTSTASVDNHQPEKQENLTPADWAAEFRRGNMGEIPSESAVDNDSDSDDIPSSHGPAGHGADDSDENGDDDSPYVDLHKPATLRHCTQSLDRKHPERIPESETDEQHWPTANAARHVRTLSGGGEDKAPVLAAEQLHEAVEATKEGLLRRRLSDGTVVTVPLDDAELSRSS